MFKYSFLLLFLTLPLPGGEPLLGVPLWVYASLGATLLYALSLIVTIEREWDRLKGDDDA